MIKNKIMEMIEPSVLAAGLVLYQNVDHSPDYSSNEAEKIIYEENNPVTIVCGPGRCRIYFGSDIPPKEKVCPGAEELLKEYFEWKNVKE